MFRKLNGNLRPRDPTSRDLVELVTEYFPGWIVGVLNRVVDPRRNIRGGKFEFAINYLCYPTVLTFSPATPPSHIPGFLQEESYFQIFLLKFFPSNRSV